MSYSNFCPANDWFFCSKNTRDGTLIVSPVAMWATEQYEVVGLLGGSAGEDKRFLAPPPPEVQGCYLHHSQLNAEQLESIKKH